MMQIAGPVAAKIETVKQMNGSIDTLKYDYVPIIIKRCVVNRNKYCDMK